MKKNLLKLENVIYNYFNFEFMNFSILKNFNNFFIIISYDFHFKYFLFL